MTRLFLAILFLLANLPAFCSRPDGDKILGEGKLLYRLERASWFGTDDFLARYPYMRDSIQGYLSYETENHLVTTIFFNMVNGQHILARYQFDSLPQEIPLTLDTIHRIPTDHENDLISIRQNAWEQILKNDGNFFSFYENTSFNLIPLITDRDRMVFILTGPRNNNTVILGNDYLLHYNKKNLFKKREKLHNSLIQFPWKSDDAEKPLTSTMHSHVLSDCITSTDICTLLLYSSFLEWKNHYVIGRDFVSIFDLEKQSLVILTRKVWEKITNNIEKNAPE